MILFVYLDWCLPWSVWIIFIGLVYGGFFMSHVLQYIYYNPVRNIKPLMFRGNVVTIDQCQHLLDILDKNKKWNSDILNVVEENNDNE